MRFRSRAPSGASPGSSSPGWWTCDGPRGGPRSRPGGRGRGNHNRSAWRRLHGGCHQVARLRIHRVEPRFELPRHPRVDHQLRQQPGARVPHVLPRGIVCGDGPWLLQGRGANRWPSCATGRSASSTRRWPSTSVLRPRACVHPRGQPPGCDDAAARGGMGAQRAGRGRHGPRLRQVGRRARLAAALRRVGRARLQDRDERRR